MASRYDDDVAYLVANHGVPLKSNFIRRDEDVKMRYYSTIVPEIQKRLGDNEA